LRIVESAGSAERVPLPPVDFGGAMAAMGSSLAHVGRRCRVQVVCSTVQVIGSLLSVRIRRFVKLSTATGEMAG
jgi:hypothetical protein